MLSVFVDPNGAPVLGGLHRTILYPRGRLGVLEAIAVSGHLAAVLSDIQRSLLEWSEQDEQAGPLNEDRLPSRQPKGRQGALFDATA